MKLRSAAFGLAALSLVASPVLAQAAMERSNAPIEEENDLAGGPGILLGALAVAAVIGAVIVAADEDDTQLPVSS